jgi:hypothetical protein
MAVSAVLIVGSIDDAMGVAAPHAGKNDVDLRHGV